MAIQWFKLTSAVRSTAPMFRWRGDIATINVAVCELIAAPANVKVGVDPEEMKVYFQKTAAEDPFALHIPKPPKKNTVRLRGGKQLAEFLQSVPKGNYILRTFDENTWFFDYNGVKWFKGNAGGEQSQG